MGIKVKDVAFVRFQAPDLDEMERFLSDFGMVRSGRTDDTLYMRGTGDEGFVHVTHLAPEAGLVSWAFLADSVEELEALAADDEFSAVEPLEGPGGGFVVKTTDPDGFQIEVIAGRESVGTRGTPFVPVRNDGTGYRRKGEPVRLNSAPAHIKRLGHCLITVSDYKASQEWYAKHFGLVISDEVHTDEGKVLGAFLRCDQGSTYVDHHTLGVIGTGTAKFGHCAFEVESFDDLMLGNAVLAGAGHDHQKGIGRHVLGSQIYDYWKDPWGNVLEHWTDGDLFNDETPPQIADVEQLRGDQWGPKNTISALVG